MDELVVRELNRKYAHTYAAIINKVTKQKIVLYVNGVGEHGIQKGSTFYPLNEWDFCKMPYSRVFNCSGRVFVYRHRPERQWQIGLVGTNTVVFDPIAPAMQLRDLLPLWEDTQHFVDLLDPAYIAMSYDEASTLANKHMEVSRRLDDKFWISCKDKETSWFLWFFEYPIGIVDTSRKIITITNPLFAQEINDFNARHGEVNYGIE